MKSYPYKKMLLAIIGTLLLFLPMIANSQMAQPAQTGQGGAGLPPVGQQLVREGELAVKLVFALGVGDVTEEAEAESGLGAIGISPKNGWIADYPVTPNIAGELRLAVAEVADAGKLSIDKQRALNEFDNVLIEFGLPISPYSEGIAAAGEPVSEPVPTEPPVVPDVPQVNEEVVNNYYYTEGPPVITYYPPPPTYSSLYWWVPYPFFCTGHLFHGFFILHDFHRTVLFHHRSFFVTNHFRDIHTHRVFRIHPESRFKGDSISHRYWRGASRNFQNDRRWDTTGQFTNRSRGEASNQSDGSVPLSRPARVFSQPSDGSSIRINQPVSTPDTVVAPSSQSERSFNTSSGRSGREDRRSLVRGRTSTPATPTGRSFNRQSVGSGTGMPGISSGESSDRGSGQGRSFNSSSALDNRSFSRPSSQGDNRLFSRPSSRGDNRSFNRPSSRGDNRSFSRPSSRGDNRSFSGPSSRGENRSFSGSSSRGGQSSRGGGRGRR